MNGSNDSKRTCTELVRLFSSQNAASLKKQLPDSYELVDRASYEPDHIVMCIIDTDSWEANYDELLSIRKSQEPVDVPVMLMVKADTLGRLSRDIWEEVDQLLPTPISKNILLAQLRNMRQNRQKSIRLAEQNSTLLQHERTLRNQAEKSLEKFEDMLHQAPSAICMLEGPDHQYTYANETYRDIFRKKEFIGRTVEEVFPEIVDQGFTDLLDQVYKSGECFRTGERSIKVWDTIKEESYELEMDFIYKPLVDDEGNTYGIFVEVINVTDEVRYRAELEEKLDEKKILLAEIHHRVKNNLAVVSGMMHLQAFEEKDAVLKQKLNSSIGRIKTMGSIHELLYQSESFCRLEADKNIEKLVTEIASTFQTNVELDLRFDFQKISLNINQAIPFSLIINEVVTNVFKHAFDEQEQGILSVTLTEEGNLITFQATDNGKGLPPEFPKFESSNSLGMQLIETLSSQLKADYNYQMVEGKTQFMLTFEKADVMGTGNSLL